MRKNWPKCPRCKTQQVELIEHWKSHIVAWLPDANEDDGILEPGDPYKVEGKCLECGHHWKIRNAIQIDSEWFEESEAN
jgi:Zn ribbon nucleic-acid-binding protein